MIIRRGKAPARPPWRRHIAVSGLAAAALAVTIFPFIGANEVAPGLPRHVVAAPGFGSADEQERYMNGGMSGDEREAFNAMAALEK